MKKYKLFLASVLNPIDDEKCQYFPQGAILLKYQSNKKKRGYFIEKVGKAQEVLKKLPIDLDIVVFQDALIMPAFFDVHFHWVQDDVREMPKKDLLLWLQNHTFPTEKKFKSLAYARKKARSFFQKLINHGTLGGACYGSLHEHTVDLAFEYGVGHFKFGNPLMTMNSPKFLNHSKDTALRGVERLSKRYEENYAVTPRFAITTDPDTMEKAGKIGLKNNSFIQTHLAETKAEIKTVLSIYKKIEGFEKVKSYTEIYDECGLLTKKTIMGHGIYLDNREIKLIKKRKTTIAHCPTSNAPHRDLGLGSGLFDFKKIEKHKISWALASDIGGGPYLSMFDVMNSFVKQNRKKKRKASFTKALYRSTLAGAKILDVDDVTGNLKKGKEANFIVVAKPHGQFEDVEVLLEKLHDIPRTQYERLVQETYFRGWKVSESI